VQVTIERFHKPVESVAIAFCRNHPIIVSHCHAGKRL
jgi:hypothetical protein